jgi:hypothetical protein
MPTELTRYDAACRALADAVAIVNRGLRGKFAQQRDLDANASLKKLRTECH